MTKTFLTAKLFLICSLLILNTNIAAQEIQDTVKVTAGKLSIVKFEEKDFSIILNPKIVKTDYGTDTDGEIITGEDNVFVSFGKQFSFSDADVVILNSTVGGNASGETHRIITVWHDGSASVSQYIGNGVPPKITQKDDSLTLYFPAAKTLEGRMAAETWTWQAGKTTKVRAKPQKKQVDF